MSSTGDALIGTVPLFASYGIVRESMKLGKGTASKPRGRGGYCPICKARFPDLKAHMKRDMEHSGSYGRRHKRFYERHLV